MQSLEVLDAGEAIYLAGPLRCPLKCKHCLDHVSLEDCRRGYCTMSPNTYHEIETKAIKVDDPEELRRKLDSPYPWSGS